MIAFCVASHNKSKRDSSIFLCFLLSLCRNAKRNFMIGRRPENPRDKPDSGPVMAHYWEERAYLSDKSCQMYTIYKSEFVWETTHNWAENYYYSGNKPSEKLKCQNSALPKCELPELKTRPSTGPVLAVNSRLILLGQYQRSNRDSMLSQFWHWDRIRETMTLDLAWKNYLLSLFNSSFEKKTEWKFRMRELSHVSKIQSLYIEISNLPTSRRSLAQEWHFTRPIVGITPVNHVGSRKARVRPSCGSLLGRSQFTGSIYWQPVTGK